MLLTVVCSWFSGVFFLLQSYKKYLSHPISWITCEFGWFIDRRTLYSLFTKEVCYITCFPLLLFFELMPNLRLTKVNGIIVCQVIHLKS